MKQCNFEELPQALQKSVTRLEYLKSSKVLRCLYDGKNYAECTILNGSLIGVFNHSYGEVDNVWLTSRDIEILHNAIESTRP
ncbi:hypothetical protein [Desulfosporosinus sp. OT]|uniref:hypothetical protein n=1 Tax=Desulfosporosinus sp. OT TaxID=913865 RepID=UPI0003092C97|nr:hypothetical protein [Desulfosporosinus sp. OT]